MQGYAYDAKLRTAELAREVWGDAGLAERLERDAADLQRRFDEAYWTGEHYALALDRDGAQVDSLCSNIGHLLWSGIVPDERVDAVVAALMGERALVGLGHPHDVRRATRPTTRSRTTTAPSGPTTTP